MGQNHQTERRARQRKGQYCQKIRRTYLAAAALKRALVHMYTSNRLRGLLQGFLTHGSIRVVTTTNGFEGDAVTRRAPYDGQFLELGLGRRDELFQALV